jgi:hypothetical protein
LIKSSNYTIVSKVLLNCLSTFRLYILLFSLTATVIVLMITAIDNLWFNTAVTGA